MSENTASPSALTQMVTSTKAVEAWLKTLPSVPAGMVGPSLPADPTKWADAFYQVITVGGTPHPNLSLRQPVVEVSVWANTPNTVNPPYNRAEAHASALLYAGLEARTMDLTTDQGVEFTLLGILPLGEPVRVPDNRTGYARVMLQFQAWWSE